MCTDSTTPGNQPTRRGAFAFNRINAFVDGGYLFGLRKIEVSVWLVLQRHADVHGVAYPAVSTIAAIVRRSESLVRDALAQLRRFGLWEPVDDGRGGRGKSARRKLTVPSPLPETFSRHGEQERVLAGRTLSAGRGGRTLRPDETKGSSPVDTKGPVTQAQTVRVGRTQTEHEETPAQISNSGAAGSAALAARDSDVAEAICLLVEREGIGAGTAAQLLAGANGDGLALVRQAIANADDVARREGFRTTRSGYLIDAIRQRYAPRAATTAVSRTVPALRVAAAAAEERAKLERRQREEKARARQERAEIERLSALPAEDYQRMEAEAKAACPMARGTLMTSPVLRALAIREMDKLNAIGES